MLNLQLRCISFLHLRKIRIIRLDKKIIDNFNLKKSVCPLESRRHRVIYLIFALTFHFVTILHSARKMKRVRNIETTCLQMYWNLISFRFNFDEIPVEISSELPFYLNSKFTTKYMSIFSLGFLGSKMSKMYRVSQ